MEVLKKNLKFKSSFQFPCSYLKNKYEKRLYINLNESEDKNLLVSELTRNGFRRNLDHMYIPICESCCLCIPTRIAIKEFELSKSTKRNLKKNSDLFLKEEIQDIKDARYKLFKIYSKIRHHESHMKNMSKKDFEIFFCSSKNNVKIFDLVDKNNNLYGSILVDVFLDGFSAVYSFFDPSHGNRGLGKNLVIKTINELRSQDKSYLYLGYWVKDSRKMNYKINFNSLELFIEGKWVKKELIRI